MPVLQLPKDVVAVQSGDKAYLFYLNSERKLTYLVSPNADGDGDYIQRRIDDENGDDIVVNDKSTQIAAIGWDEPNGVFQIRVYYVAPKGNLSEVCWTSTDPRRWYQGSLGLKNKAPHYIADGSPISATAYKRNINGQSRWSLRVFASGKDHFNDRDNPVISVYMFDYNETGQNKGSWGSEQISNAVNKW
ncbi:hypothetical protein MRS44_001919 [Fusarium solani]|uniref:Fucose-specific lectin n=1 Tax=Fusarium solani TaxID=169388 RepID=A0A9P9JUT4_FUSSL|nr:uncharacterized protein B0J15DRAFT_471993 [Fusarium solani]KAH7234116.1 hypothetical protein B0J15DRAFT_471993 [Fusarium solani]KAJ3471820.1 hypothetical protein MRS44_001919 [Fusarium solani]